MAGILGNDKTLSSKAAEIAAAITGEVPAKDGIPDEAILLHDFKLRGIDPKAGLIGSLAEIRKGALKMYRKGNTIMAVKKLNPITAQAHFFTLDKEEAFQHAVKEFLDSLRKSGCKVVYDRVADPHNIRALQAAGALMQQPDADNYKLKALI